MARAKFHTSSIKDHRIGLLLVAGVLLLIFFDFTLPTLPEAEAALNELHGWAWSSNIGWISVNCADPGAGGCAGTNYKVSYDDASGDLSGYAWSSNIGFIRFDPPAAPDPAYPEAPQNSVKITGGSVTGWARSCSVFASNCSGALRPSAERGGWDGWIKMYDDAAFDSGTGKLSGFAWGSLVVGWIKFCDETTSNPFCVTTIAVPPPLDPDLVISAPPSLASGSFIAGSTVTFKGTVENQGGATASAAGGFNNRFEIDIGNDGSVDTTLTPHPVIVSLAPGVTQEVTSGSWSGIPAGTHRVILCADQPTPKVTESDETNNCAATTVGVGVGGPPLACTPTYQKVKEQQKAVIRVSSSAPGTPPYNWFWEGTESFKDDSDNSRIRLAWADKGVYKVTVIDQVAQSAVCEVDVRETTTIPL